MGTIDINAYPTVRDRKMCLGDTISFINMENLIYVFHPLKETNQDEN